MRAVKGGGRQLNTAMPATAIAVPVQSCLCFFIFRVLHFVIQLLFDDSDEQYADWQQ